LFASKKTQLSTPTLRNSQEDIIMVEELEKEYAVLKDKVRELREYL
jgi:hypothetical protein